MHLPNALGGNVEYSGFAYYASAVHGTVEHGQEIMSILRRMSMTNRRTRTGKVSSRLPFSYFGSVSKVAVVAFCTRTNTFARGFIKCTNAPVNKAVCKAGNGYWSFVCYKDDGRVLFKQNGCDFFTEYNETNK